MHQSVPSKKERYRQQKVLRDEPYAMTSEEDLIRTCLSGGRPNLRQTVSVPDQSKELTKPPTTRKLPTKTTDTQNPQLIRSFSASYNTIPSLAPPTSYLSHLDLNADLANDNNNRAGLIVPQPNKDISPNNTNAPKKDLSSKPTQLDPNACGLFTFRPLEGQFPVNKDHTRRMKPYCKIKIGHHSGKTSVAETNGSSPVWSSAILLERRHSEQFAKIKVKDYDKLAFYDQVGEAKIPLSEIASQGKVSRWVPIYKKNNVAGQVLVEINFEPINAVMYH